MSLRSAWVIFAFVGASVSASPMASSEAGFTLLAVDSEAGTVVFETSRGELLLSRIGEPVGDSGFRLQSVSAAGASLVLSRNYQGRSLSQQLNLGEPLQPGKILELEQADKRAAHAMEILARPATMTPARSPPD